MGISEHYRRKLLQRAASGVQGAEHGGGRASVRSDDEAGKPLLLLNAAGEIAGQVCLQLLGRDAAGAYSRRRIPDLAPRIESQGNTQTREDI
ncbi:hypothetical protein D3C71_2075960 [compost metagenome]